MEFKLAAGSAAGDAVREVRELWPAVGTRILWSESSVVKDALVNLVRTVRSCFKRKEVGSRPEGGCWWNVLDFHEFCLWSLNNFYMRKLLCALDVYRNGWYISQIQQASTLLKCSVPGALWACQPTWCLVPSSHSQANTERKPSVAPAWVWIYNQLTWQQN